MGGERRGDASVAWQLLLNWEDGRTSIRLWRRSRRRHLRLLLRLSLSQLRCCCHFFVRKIHRRCSSCCCLLLGVHRRITQELPSLLLQRDPPVGLLLQFLDEALDKLLGQKDFRRRRRKVLGSQGRLVEKACRLFEES